MSDFGRRLWVLECHLSAHGGANANAAPIGLHPCRAPAAAPAAAAAGAAPTAPVVLVGGMVMDLQAHPSGPADVQRGGSVPGRVTQSAGGVARNVGEALALLLTSGGALPSQLPLLVSAVGDDLAGKALLQHWHSLGLSSACITQVPGGATPTVAAVFDLGGEVAACVADVALLERQLAPPLLRAPAVRAALAAAPVVMLDGNLSEAALQEACRQAGAAGVPVWFEPVSAPKSTRAASLLGALTYASPNERELAAMAAAVRQQQQVQGCGSGSGCQACGCGRGGTSGGSGSQSCSSGKGCGCSGVNCQACSSGKGCGCSSCSCQACTSGKECGCRSSRRGCQTCSGGKECGSNVGSSSGSQACSSGRGSGCTECTICGGAPCSFSTAVSSESSGQLGLLPCGAGAALRGMLPDIATLLLAGLRHLVITLGAEGAALCTLARRPHLAVEVCHVPALPAKVTNCSGAGDCLVAGCLFGLAQGVSPEAALCHGVAAARAAVESQTNVPAGLTAAAVRAGAAAAHAQSVTVRLRLSAACAYT